MAPRKGALHVHLDGCGGVTLRDADYMTSGGEGSIYRTGNTVVKIYADPGKMRGDGMPEKIQALSKIKRVGIVAPEGVVRDATSREPVGFHMPFVGGEPLSRVFVSDYRLRIGFDDRAAIDLAGDMHSIVECAHAGGAVMVDANELNWLFHYRKGASPAAAVIDVDSWAIGRWPATVIMPSIRDWSAKTFSPATDWFAWGVVTFQIFTGIHPYKGKVDGYKPADLIKRMKDGVSVFAPGVRMPAAVRDFACIPGPLRDWYHAAFQEGERTKPPHPHQSGSAAKVVLRMRAVTTGATGALVFEKMFERTGDPAARVWANGAVRLTSGDVCDLATGKTIGGMQSADGEIVRLPDGGWLIAISIAGQITFGHVAGDLQVRHLLDSPVRLRRVFRAGERLFGVTENEMVEILHQQFGKRSMITVGRRWQVMVNSTKWFDDVAVMDALGAAFVIIPSGDGVHQVRVHELDGAQIVTAKAGGRFAAFVVLEPNGDYRKIELIFQKDFTKYQVWTGSADSAELNMGILPRGVVATIINDGELAIVVPSSGDVRKVADRGVTTEMKLGNWGETIVYIKDGAVWKMRMAP
jgi:hypothetical protein